MMKALSLPCCNEMFGTDPRRATGECVTCGSDEFWIDAAWQTYKIPIIIGAVLLIFAFSKR